MHPILLTGAYDWDADALPAAEFEERVAEVRRLMDRQGWGALLASASGDDFGALGYLTNFAPKVGRAYGFVARNGPVRLLAGVDSRMLPAAKALTWVAEPQPGRDLAATLPKWLDEDKVTGPVAVAGFAKLPSPMFRALSEALGARGAPVDADPALYALRAVKRPREVALIKRSAAILDAAIKEIGARAKSGAAVVEAVLAGERAARAGDAQDVRTLFSFDGGRTLVPYEEQSDTRSDPLVAYLALQYRGYWTDGFATFASARSAAIDRARRALDRGIAAMRPGADAASVFRAVAEEIGPSALHPMCRTSVGYGIGLTAEEPPALAPNGAAKLAEGIVCSVRAGVGDARDGHAIVSALLRIGAGGPETLWRAP
jgi:Xaa-Pro aminopeptidase